MIASLQGCIVKKVHFRFGHFFEQIQLIFCEIQFRRHFVFVGCDEALDIFLDEFDGRCPTCLAVVAQRTVLPADNLKVIAWYL